MRPADIVLPNLESLLSVGTIANQLIHEHHIQCRLDM